MTMGGEGMDARLGAGPSPIPPKLREDLRRLGEQVAAADRARAGPAGVGPTDTLQFAARAGSDLVAAALLGVACGAAVDAACGTWPLAIVALTIVAAVAAVRTSHRTAKAMAVAKPGGTAAGSQ